MTNQSWLLAGAALWAAVSLPAVAGERNYAGHGYGWFSIDSAQGAAGEAIGFGGGADGFVYRGLAAGFDLGYVTPRECMSGGIGLLSVNPSYHFVNRTNFVPFVTGGWSLGFRSGAEHMFNYGGGATYWFSRHVGGRAEVRDFRMIWWGQERFMTSVRFSVAFR